MGLGVSHQSSCVPFGGCEIAGPYEYIRSPGQSDGKRCGVAAALGVFDGFTRPLHGLGRMALHPQASCKAEANEDTVNEPKISPLGMRPMLKRSLKL